MPLQKDNYIDIINAYSVVDWQPLLDLIPQIEHTENFGEVVVNKATEEGFTQLPFWNEAQIVRKFERIAYNMPIIINFDWGAWDEGRKMVNDDDFDFDSVDIPTKCKIITAISRNNRFCEGVLVSAFSSGLILKILKSIRKQLRDIG